MIDIRVIDVEMVYNIRHNILRPHQSFDECKYDSDYKEHSFHIGGFYDGKLVTIASFCIESYHPFSYNNQYRLRAMATIDEYRNMGVGRMVIHFAENILKKRDVKLLWCKARTSALKYYEKVGFKTYGNVFDYPGIGEHIIMYKEL